MLNIAHINKILIILKTMFWSRCPLLTDSPGGCMLIRLFSLHCLASVPPINHTYKDNIYHKYREII